MAVLSTAARKKLPSKSFALPGKGEGPQGKGAGSYPIPDPSHARNALARVSQHGSSSEKARVRAKVHAKFPGIGKQEGGEVRESEEHHEKEKKLIGELHRMEEKEKVEHRAHGGPVKPRESTAGIPTPKMKSMIGPRKLRDQGPKYPKQAMGYVS